MAEYTNNLNLTKLQDNEHYDGNVENVNLDKIDEAIGGKVDKEVGKGLSEENFTAVLKVLLESLPNGLENKVNKEDGKGLSTNDLTNALLTKLNNLISYPNVTSIEIGSDLTGNRPTAVDLHSSDDPSQTDYSARLLRNAGLNGALELLNKGLGGLLFNGHSVWHEGNDNDLVKTQVTSLDLDKLLTSGMYRINLNTNRPSGTDYGQVIVSRNADTVIQIGISYNTADISFRGGVISPEGIANFNDWKTIWNSGNDGINSDLDAGKLRGQINATAATPSTIVSRDLDGDIISRSFYPTLSTNNTTIASIITQSSTPGIIKPTSPSTLIDALNLFTKDNYGKVISEGVSFTPLLSHRNSFVRMINAVDATVTIQRDSSVNMDVGTIITFTQRGSGDVTFVAASDVTLFSEDQKRTIANQYSLVSLVKMAPNEWGIFGPLK